MTEHVLSLEMRAVAMVHVITYWLTNLQRSEGFFERIGLWVPEADVAMREIVPLAFHFYDSEVD